MSDAQPFPLCFLQVLDEQCCPPCATSRMLCISVSPETLGPSDYNTRTSERVTKRTHSSLNSISHNCFCHSEREVMDTDLKELWILQNGVDIKPMNAIWNAMQERWDTHV